MRAAVLQLTAHDSPAANVAPVRDAVRAAAAAGAGFILTPECTNCISSSRSHQRATLTVEGADPVVEALRHEAARAGVWVLAGSVLLAETGAERFVNRSLLIGPDGAIAARYDKIHLFDVDVSPTETYRESSAIRPGDRAVLAPTPFATLGLTICYDIRFPHLHRALAQAGAEVLCIPAAFSPVTGAAHWEPLLRARAIETGCYVLAPAQTGQHPVTAGPPRRTHGHALAVAPWGEVLADAGTEPGMLLIDLDLAAVREARRRVPALIHDRPFAPPTAGGAG
jgi:deaminated glutathione amidase